MAFAATAGHDRFWPCCRAHQFSAFVGVTSFGFWSCLLYPIAGSLAVGMVGWLSEIGLSLTLPSSSIVHSFVAWPAWSGAIILGPRIGKFRQCKNPGSLPDNKHGIATLGCLISGSAWYGFNPGSVLAMDSDVPYGPSPHPRCSRGAISGTLVPDSLAANLT